MSPGIGPAVVRVGEAPDTGLVAVIDGRSPGPGHLQQDGLPHDLHAHIFHGRIEPQILGPADYAVGPGQEAGVVVVGELVHADPEDIAGQGLLAGPQDRLPEGVRIAVALLVPAVAVFFHAGEEPCHGLHEELVVHDRVPLVALQPLPGIHVVFRDDDRLRVGLLDGLAEALPEAVVEFFGIAQVRGHVQAPAVRAVGRGDPFFRDPEYVVTELFGLLIVELGQGAEIPPGVIAVIGGPVVAIEFEVLHEGGPLGGPGPLESVRQLLIDLFGVQPAVEGPAVVEHAVQDDPDPSLMGRPDQPGKEPVACLQVGRVGHAL